MSEPIHEATEEAWLEFFNRFDSEIYPVIFASRGIPRPIALISWQMQSIASALDALIERLDESVT